MIQQAMSTDSQLVADSLAGHKDAFGSIVHRHQGMVSGVLYCICGSISRSEELAQETFIAAWNGLPQLRDPAQLPAWLRGIARRVGLSAVRTMAQRPRAVSLEQTPVTPAGGGPGPAEQLITKEEQEVMWSALERIPEQYREPMVLYYRQQQTVAAVASALELSEEAVRQRLSRGRAMLREQVAATVERSLQASRPGAAFTLAVLAALPAVIPKTAMAAVGATAAKGSTAAKGIGAISLIGMWIGLVLAVIVGTHAAAENLRRARSPRERQFVKQWTAVLVLCIVGFIVLCSATIVWGRRWFHDADTAVTAQSVLWGGGYFILLTSLAVYARRRQRQIQIEDGTFRGDEELVPSRTPRKRVGGLAIGLVAGLSWMVGLAAQAGDWINVAIVVGVGLVAWGMSAMIVLRGGRPAILKANLLMWAFVMALSVGMINLRMPFWIAKIEGVSLETIEQHMPWVGLNVLIAVIAIGGGVMMWVGAPSPIQGKERQSIR